MAWLTLDEVKDHLQIPLTDTTEDAELWDARQAAVEWVESRVGPIDQQTITEVCQPGPVLLLSRAPVQSVTSVASAYGNGADYDPADLYLDGTAGTIRGAYRFTCPVTVTYVAGAPDPLNVPASYRQAALEITRAVWGAQRAGLNATDLTALLQGSTADVEPSAASSLGLAQYRAEALIAPYRVPTGIA